MFPAEELRVVFGPEHGAVEAEPLGRGVPAATHGVWVVRAGANAAVLKLVHHDPVGHSRWPAAAELKHPYYWRREVCAYETSFLERLPAPHCHACVERADGSVALWLEALAEPAHTIERYGLAARHLGQTQGAFAAAVPTEPWLDFYPGNLFGDDEKTILIDWAYCGIGAVGEDPGNFVPDAILDGFVDANQADELERVVWDGYLAGLADAGWKGDERAVRFAFAATPWLKYEWLKPAVASGTVDAETVARWEATLPLVDRLGEEASELASSP
jgi:hypothetical protein